MENITVSNTDELKKVLSERKTDMTVQLSSGTYRIDHTIDLRGFCNVKFKGEEGTVFYGGDTIKNFAPTEKENIYSAALSSDIPEFSMRGYSFVPPKGSLMFYRKGKNMIMSRYPKEGFINIKKIISDGKDGKPSVFEYEDSRFDTFSEEKNLLLFGYFCWMWADATVKAYIDRDKKQIIMDPPYHYKNEYYLSFIEWPMYFAENIFSELTEEAEYYLDYESKKVFFVGEEPVEWTSLKDNMIEMDNASHISFENIVFDMGQASAIVGSNVNNIEIRNCEIKRFSGEGIKLSGNNISIENNDIHTFGRGAVEVCGGDFDTLMSGNINICNNKIYDVGNIDRTYVPCVFAKGVGITVSHNDLFYAPSSVFRLEGNDCIFEYNNVYDSVRESDDQGCIDMYNNSSYRGNVFRYNYFHDNGAETELKTGNSGIRFDDIISGQHVYGNIFRNTSKGPFGAVQINSGRDNIIENNIIINSENAFSGGFNHINPAWAENVNDPEVFYTDLYLKKYPDMKKCYDETGEVCKDGTNIYRNNIIINCEKILSDRIYSDIEKENLPDMHSEEIILTKNDIDENFQVNIKDFPQIPFKEIGRKQ